MRVEGDTKSDELTPAKARILDATTLDYIVVSMYERPIYLNALLPPFLIDRDRLDPRGPHAKFIASVLFCLILLWLLAIVASPAGL